MRIRTRIAFDSDEVAHQYHYSFTIQCADGEAIDSLESHLEESGFASEHCGMDFMEGFASAKLEFDNKADFESQVRKSIKEWKAKHRK